MLKCSSLDIRTIYLMLGEACNFRCRYCLQDCHDGRTMKKDVKISENVINYIRRLAKAQKIKIMFWGGEPLIYLDTIKKCVSALGDAAEYGIVTNGSLLDEETVEFLNDNGFTVSLSHDGPNTIKTRGVDILPRIAPVFSKIEKRGALGVLSAYNQDYQAFKEYVNSFAPNTPCSWETLKVTWDMPKELYAFDFGKLNESLQKMKEDAISAAVNGIISPELNFFMPELRLIAHKSRNIIEIPRCQQFYSALDIDCNGNIFACHNSREKIGEISEDRINVAVRYNEFLEKNKKENCAACLFLDFCHSGCPLEQEHEEVCTVRKMIYSTACELSDELVKAFYEPLEL